MSHHTKGVEAGENITYKSSDGYFQGQANESHHEKEQNRKGHVSAKGGALRNSFTKWQAWVTFPFTLGALGATVAPPTQPRRSEFEFFLAGSRPLSVSSTSWLHARFGRRGLVSGGLPGVTWAREDRVRGRRGGGGGCRWERRENDPLNDRHECSETLRQTISQPKVMVWIAGGGDGCRHLVVPGEIGIHFRCRCRVLGRGGPPGSGIPGVGGGTVPSISGRDRFLSCTLRERCGSHRLVIESCGQRRPGRYDGEMSWCLGSIALVRTGGFIHWCCAGRWGRFHMCWTRVQDRFCCCSVGSCVGSEGFVGVLLRNKRWGLTLRYAGIRVFFGNAARDALCLVRQGFGHWCYWFSVTGVLLFFVFIGISWCHWKLITCHKTAWEFFCTPITKHVAFTLFPRNGLRSVGALLI